MVLLGWTILILGGIILAIWLSREEESYSDPLSRTDSGLESSRYERNVLNKSYASEISRPKARKKSKHRSRRK